MTKAGATASSLPKCKYFDEMAFLHEKSCNRPSESNLQSQKTLSCKKRKVDVTEVHLTKQLSDTDNDIKKLLTESESEDSLYCRSLVPMLEMVPLKKKRLAKIRISQLLYELQFDENVTKLKKYKMLVVFLASGS